MLLYRHNIVLGVETDAAATGPSNFSQCIVILVSFHFVPAVASRVILALIRHTKTSRPCSNDVAQWQRCSSGLPGVFSDV